MRFILIACLFLSQFALQAQTARRLELLFLGDKGHHKPFDRLPALQSAVGVKGMNITYTESLKDLNTAYLNKFDALVIYANHDSISTSQEAALKSFVQGGKALIPLHSASFCFRNSDWYVQAVGGQFSTHGTGRFTTKLLEPNLNQIFL